jgi:hypothetical protein
MRAAARWESSARSTSVLGRPVVGERRGGAAIAQQVAGRVEPDPGEPGPEGGVVAEAVERQHRGEHRVLRGVGGEVGVTRRAPGGGAQEPGVAVDQLRQRVAVAPAGLADEGGVVGLHGPGADSAARRVAGYLRHRGRVRMWVRDAGRFRPA